MLKELFVAACLAVGAGAAAFSAPVPVDPTVQKDATLNTLALNRLASNRLSANRLASNKLAANKLSANKLSANRLASNRLASNKLSANGLPLDGMSLIPTGPGDVTPVVAVLAVTLADGTRLEIPASR